MAEAAEKRLLFLAFFLLFRSFLLYLHFDYQSLITNATQEKK